jgi:hypothetical protein
MKGKNKHMKTKTNTIYLATALFAFACFALSPQARAVCQEGCLTNQNTVLGEDALLNNTGSFNIAIGYQSLFSNTTGEQNTATGYQALFFNTTGFQNTATGIDALVNNRTGFQNIATGRAALAANTTGSQNTAVGDSALANNTTFNGNIALGNGAGTHLKRGGNNIYIGNAGPARESRTIRIGTTQTHRATFIAGISRATVPTGVAVIVDGDGHLGTTTSSARFKQDIQPMDKASETILALKPVTFRYKRELDRDGIPQFGLVAEQVEKVNPDLVARDEQGKPYTVRYEAVNAMLLNEFLKEHRKGQEQDATISQLKAELAQQRKDFQAVAAHQQKQIEALTAGLQKVSAQVEMSRPASQMVLNNQ